MLRCKLGLEAGVTPAEFTGLILGVKILARSANIQPPGTLFIIDQNPLPGHRRCNSLPAGLGHGPGLLEQGWCRWGWSWGEWGQNWRCRDLPLPGFPEGAGKVNLIPRQGEGYLQPGAPGAPALLVPTGGTVGPGAAGATADKFFHG